MDILTFRWIVLFILTYESTINDPAPGAKERGEDPVIGEVEDQNPIVEDNEDLELVHMDPAKVGDGGGLEYVEQELVGGGDRAGVGIDT